jgi:hypothetical protein
MRASVFATTARSPEPFQIAGNSAHEVMGLPQSIQGDVDVQFEILILGKAMLCNFINAIGLETIRRKIDIADTVIPHKKDR